MREDERSIHPESVVPSPLGLAAALQAGRSAARR